MKEITDKVNNRSQTEKKLFSTSKTNARLIMNIKGTLTNQGEKIGENNYLKVVKICE